MLAFLVVILAATPAGPKAPVSKAAPVRMPANGSVVTPDGVRFQLPARLAYSVTVKDGQTVYAGKSADERTVVAVSAFTSGSELPCVADEEGVDVEAFETSRGLRACSVSAQTDDSPLAFAAVYVKSGETFVMVNAIAPAELARDLAKQVADSVEVRGGKSGKLARIDIPRPEPRLIGCFERDRSVPGAAIFWQRCFAEDFSFTQTFGFATSTHYTDLHTGRSYVNPMTDRRESGGTWLCSGDVLHLYFDDGSEAERTVRFEAENVYLDGDLWTRL